jgi:hypothetical protein
MKSNIRLFVILLFALISLTMCKNDTDKVAYIRFELENSRRIPNNKVLIEITKRNSQYILHLRSYPLGQSKWEKTRIDTTFSIDNATFKKVSREVIQLTNSDFSKSERTILDGFSSSIKFGFKEQERTYNIDTPNLDTEERGLVDYLKVCELIIQTAGLKTVDVL